jgi:hypothetical protein
MEKHKVTTKTPMHITSTIDLRASGSQLKPTHQLQNLWYVQQNAYKNSS